MSSAQITGMPFAGSQQSDLCIGNTETMDDNRQPTDLFLEISLAAMRRQRQGTEQRAKQKRLDRAWKEEHVLKPHRARAKEEEAEAKAKKLMAEMFEKELKDWGEQRYKASARNFLSRAEVDAEVHRLVDEVLQGDGMERRRLEDGTEELYDDWKERMLELRKQIYQVWNYNGERIRTGLPQYVEGCPVREGIRPPIFMAGKRQKMSGLGGCLQCEVKGLICSMSVQARDSEEEVESKGCKRCEADGERCLISCELENVEEGQGKGKTGAKKKTAGYTWDWWDGAPEREPDRDSAAEAIEMWERRRRGARLELVGGVMQWVDVGGFAPPRDDKEEEEEKREKEGE
ncbi:hypothetical protein V8C42DRAFT_247051 [Trichoderma barbatum]